jgi:hypothetical protein
MIPICYLIGADFGAGIVAGELRATSGELRGTVARSSRPEARSVFAILMRA